MSKAKRMLAILLTVLMTASLMTVMTFADTPKFAVDYDDPTGTIQKSAILVDPLLGGRNVGEPYNATWDGTVYTFTVGSNAFATYEEAVDAAGMNTDVDIPQVLLAPGIYNEIRIQSAIEIFGINWNNNPNVVNPTNPALQWAQNTAWSVSTTIVNQIVVTAGANGTITVCGVEIAGKVYDMYRPISSTKTVVTLKNILYNQTAEGVSNTYSNAPTGRNSMSRTAMTFWNLNSANTAESAKYNKDETHLINLRLKNLCMESGNNRFIDELVSPVFEIKGFCAEYSTVNINQFFWAKWRPYETNCKMTVSDSFLSTFVMNSGGGFSFESYDKTDVGKFEGQTAELHFLNNIFYNIVETGSSEIFCYLNGFSKLVVDGNTAINVSATTLDFIGYSPSSVSSSDIYTDRVFITNNTILGFQDYGFKFGPDTTKVDMTGNYISYNYTETYLTEENGKLPLGNVRYDYCYLDGARTKKSSDIPSFDLNGITPDANDSIELSVNAGTFSVIPTVTGLTKYYIYKSDENFSNIETFSEEIKEPGIFVLTNNKTYFLLAAYSYDENTVKPYKLTINKSTTDEVSLDSLINTSTGSTVTKDGLEFDVFLERAYSEFSFGINAVADNITVFDFASNSAMTAVGGVYTLTGIEPNDPITVRVTLEKSGLSEFYYINVLRGLSRNCELVSIANNASVNGSSITVPSTNGLSQITLGITIPDGARASVWQGTTVYPFVPVSNDATVAGTVKITDMKSGINEYKLGIVAEDGVTNKIYELSVNKEKNTEARVYSIADATVDGNAYTATARSKFVVSPVISDGATFKVFSDASCTQVISETVGITADRTVYIIVTSEDGLSVSTPVALNIKKSDEGVVVNGAVADAEDASLLVLTLGNNLTSATLDITKKNAEYVLYSDKKMSNPCTTAIKLDQGVTYVYMKVTYSDNEKNYLTIKIISLRTALVYSDAASIPGWAKTYVDKLGNSGLGIIKGDEKGNFNASNNMTRYEVAAIAVRLLGIDASQYSGIKLQYTDSIANWAVNYVKAVTQLGIMSGSNSLDGKLIFNGGGSTTRAQLAKIIVELSLFDNQLGQTPEQYYTKNKTVIDDYYNAFNFADESTVQNWAKTYMKLAVYAKFFNGSTVDNKNYISGNSNIKRSEIVAVASRFLGL